MSNMHPSRRICLARFPANNRQEALGSCRSACHPSLDNSFDDGAFTTSRFGRALAYLYVDVIIGQSNHGSWSAGDY